MTWFWGVVLLPGPGGEVLCTGPGGGRCCDLVPGGGVVTFGVVPPNHPWSVEVTHACENITFIRFTTRAVIMVKLPDC